MGHTVDRMEGPRLQFGLHSDILIHTFLLKFNWPGADLISDHLSISPFDPAGKMIGKRTSIESNDLFFQRKEQN